MIEDSRIWIGLAVVVFAIMVMLTVLLTVRTRAVELARVRRALALIWAAVLGSVGVGGLLHYWMGGPVFDLNFFGSPELLMRSLTGIERIVAVAALVIIVALYVTALLALRSLLAGLPDEDLDPDDGEDDS